ncbi:MAG TPA: RHS repeat-associated core domain-containing protein [Candidatus Limnocylindrales bacterium]|nr:RHS repeat-associated core domain-containing protein [Candidatus Limnocylindrales bacterium]
MSGGPSDEDTNVATDYGYDGYGQLVSTTRSNRDPAGVVLDSRQDRSVYDSLGNATAEIANYGDGVVTPGTTDIEPAAGGARTDLVTSYTYDTAGNRVSSADPRRAIAQAATTYARDAFGRTVSGGWGTADTGGTWSQASAELSVDGTAGKIALGSITNRNNYLTSVSFADGELLAKVKIDRLATGDNHLMWFYLRRQGANDYYQARLSFETSGLVKTSFARWSGGLTTTIKSQTTAVPHAVTDWYWLRARISGSTSVNAKLRLWKDGTTEPAGWDVDGTDASPPAALQGSGHIGVRFELGSGYTGAFPATASFDELTWTTIGGGGQALGTDDYVTRTTFDALNEPITTTTPTTPGVAGAAGIATTAYDELGAARSATDVSGIVSATVFDRAGRALTTYEDPAPAGSAYITAQMTYDADGKTLTAMDRRQAASPGFALGWTASGYDGLGRQTSSIEAQGSTPDVAAETRTTYDGLDRVTATEVGYGSPASQLTSLTLDLGGRATATDDGFTCTTSTYDYRDLVLTTVDSLDPTSCAANAGSRTVTNTLDALGRVTQAEVTAGPDTGDRPSIATYDGAGNALTAGRRKAGVTTTTTFSRTLLDQVVAEARPDGSTAKATYDPAGNAVDACTWASGLTVGACLPVGTSPWSNPPTNATSTRWDARNGRIALTDAASNRTTTYDPAHGYAVSAVYLPTLGDGTKEHQTTYGYDTQHRLTSITQQLCTISSGHACSSTTATGSDTYEYDDSDNRTRVVENNGNTSSDYRYCHDARNQLTGRGSTATCTTSFVETFTFDDAGNRSQAVEAGVTRNFAYTATGLLCDQETGVAASCSGGNVTSDDAGRVSDQAGWHYLYDAAARLVAACHSTACTGSGFDRLDFEYDGEGHRTKITETPSSGAAVVWTFRYQGDAIVAEYRDAVLVREYTVDDGGTISKLTIPAGQTGTGTYLVTWNGHGDALALYRIETSGSLTLANSYTYSTWGRPATLTHNGIADLGFRFLYVGAADVQWDGRFGADLLYMHARHYSPSLGRFLQGDPSRQDAKLFVYAGNRIVAKADPSGLASYAARAWVGVKDCSFPCADVVLTAIELRLYWTTRTFCIPCKPLINTYRAVPIAYSYHYGLQTGAWYPDPAVSWVGVVSGGYKRTYVTMKFVQGFKYYGLFNLYVLPAYYNRLTIWIAARSDGSFSCAFGYYIKTDPFLVKFQYPSPRCGRIY